MEATIHPTHRLSEWAEELPLWQQDALRRLALRRTLTPSDIDALMSMCKAGHCRDIEPSIAPIPFSPEVLQSSLSCQDTVSLFGIEQPENVNALASDQILEFGANGLTIIYGDNASGKSGYARILKRACRSRDRGTAIKPNVFDANSASPATAILRYSRGGTAQEHKWRDGDRPVPDLASVSFFDGSCASVYINDANDIAFTPLSLDLLLRLARVCRDVQSKLTEERQKLQEAQSPALNDPPLHGGTAVSIALQKISYESPLSLFQSLAALSPEEIKRHEQLKCDLANDPKKQAEQLRARANRIQRLADVIKKATELLSGVQVTEVAQARRDYATKQVAASTAADELFSDEPVPHIGSDIWRTLWESARRFSTGEAYPDLPFPYTGENANCPLCLQPLSDDAAARFRRFEQFIKDDSLSAAKAAKEHLNGLVAPIAALSLLPRAHRDSLIEVSQEDDSLTADPRQWLIRASLRRRSMLQAAAGVSGARDRDLPRSLHSRLEQLAQQLVTRATSLESSSDSDERTKMQAELAELSDRIWLRENLAAVSQELGRLQDLHAFSKCIAEARTTGITIKSKALAEDAVTNRLRDQFAKELRTLRINHVNLELVPAGGEYGTQTYAIRSIAAPDAKLAEVLSEGEHRCIALAGFLAELATAENFSALIFDDPVSSLDHCYRRCVAQRLAVEGNKRQVIVFTHDIVFLFLLQEVASRAGVDIATTHLQRKSAKPGFVYDGLPWIALPVKKRIGILKNELQAARAEHNRGGDGMYRASAGRIYGLLRETWERAIEEILLNGAVMRFGRGVETKRLRVVTDITEDDYQQIEGAMAKCSTFLIGHDEAAALNETMPDPTELADDIKEIEDWVSSMRKRNRI